MKNTQKLTGNEQLEKSSVVCPVIGVCEIKKENYELKQQIGYWKKQHDRARIREEELKKDIALIEGKIKYLSHQLYGRKTEQDKSDREDDKSKRKKKKGQQKENKIPKRRKYETLEEKEEVYDLPAESMVCQICKKTFTGLNSTDDSGVLEIQVKGYKRKIRKRKYIKGCDCNGGARIVTASGPGKIIPKGKIGVSIWAILLYEKYKLSIPMTRVLKKLSSFDLDIPKGTVGDGLKRLSSLFEPIYNELEKKSSLFFRFTQKPDMVAI